MVNLFTSSVVVTTKQSSLEPHQCIATLFPLKNSISIFFVIPLSPSIVLQYIEDGSRFCVLRSLPLRLLQIKKCLIFKQVITSLSELFYMV